MVRRVPRFDQSMHKLKLPKGLLYNLFSDRELGLNLVPQSVYDMQSAFYPTAEEQYGVPLDTRHDYTKGLSNSSCKFTPLTANDS